MKVSNKRGLQQIAFQYSSDIDFKDFLNLYKICSAKPYLSLANGNTLEIFLERI